MKYLITLVLVSYGLLAANVLPHNNKAEVNQLQGIYIFTDSKPVQDYNYLGTVKNGFRVAGSSQYTATRDRMIKKLKESYPDADAAIFYFNDGSADRCDAIKFKP